MDVLRLLLPGCGLREARVLLAASPFGSLALCRRFRFISRFFCSELAFLLSYEYFLFSLIFLSLFIDFPFLCRPCVSRSLISLHLIFPSRSPLEDIPDTLHLHEFPTLF